MFELSICKPGDVTKDDIRLAHEWMDFHNVVLVKNPDESHPGCGDPLCISCNNPSVKSYFVKTTEKTPAERMPAIAAVVSSAGMFRNAWYELKGFPDDDVDGIIMCVAASLKSLRYIIFAGKHAVTT